jgi:hypothetical protein
MLFTYDKNTNKISEYEEITFGSQDILERQDIEQWVEEHPSILGEELLILTSEHNRFDKTDERLDVLAIDQTGTLVIVELKRDDSGKTVELQAIKYAAYCSTMTLEEIAGFHQEYLQKKGQSLDQEAARQKILAFIENDDFEELSDKPRVILVSKEFRPEVTATVLWLRKFGLDVRCVKLTPYALNKQTIAFEANTLIPLREAEEFIIRSERKENPSSMTVTQQEYVDFYKELLSKLQTVLPGNYREPGTMSYYQIPTGIGGVHFEWGFHGRPRSSFGVELHFEKTNKEQNIEIFSRLAALKEQLEAATKESVTVVEDWGKNWSRLYIERQEGQITEELKTWAVEKMTAFIATLQPALDRIE